MSYADLAPEDMVVVNLDGAVLAERTVKRYGIGGALIGTTLVGGGFTLLIPLAGGSISGAMLMLMIAQLCGDAFSKHE